MAKTYAEKLKHPKWQKRRLEILQRDLFTCMDCGDMDTTLHIHHKVYRSGAEPWDYEDNELITLCENCHEQETVTLKEEAAKLLEAFKRSPFLSRSWPDIYTGIQNSGIRFAPEVTASAIGWFLKDVENIGFMVELYFKYLHDKNKNNGQ
jgi:hypothetical protein